MHVRHTRRATLEGADAGSPYAARDACGVGFIARQSGERTHEVVELALAAAARLAHRGAQGADLSADGAGLLTQIPKRLFILAGSRQGLPRMARRAREPRGVGSVGARGDAGDSTGDGGPTVRCHR